MNLYQQREIRLITKLLILNQQEMKVVINMLKGIDQCSSVEEIDQILFSQRRIQKHFKFKRKWMIFWTIKGWDVIALLIIIIITTIIVFFI